MNMDIEFWRIRQLVLVLEQIVRLLSSGRNAEWAGVFSHYLHEIERQFLKKTININALSGRLRIVALVSPDLDSFV